MQRRIDLNPTAFAAYIASVGAFFLPFSFLSFSHFQCKGRRNPSMIRKSGNRFSEKIMLNNEMRS
jgi:hypothetical protein